MSKYVELIDRYLIKQHTDGDYNPQSYIWQDNVGILIRCRDCKHSQLSDDFVHCKYVTWWNGPDDFCSLAERKECGTE